LFQFTVHNVTFTVVAFPYTLPLLPALHTCRCCYHRVTRYVAVPAEYAYRSFAARATVVLFVVDAAAATLRLRPVVYYRSVDYVAIIAATTCRLAVRVLRAHLRCAVNVVTPLRCCYTFTHRLRSTPLRLPVCYTVAVTTAVCLRTVAALLHRYVYAALPALRCSRCSRCLPLFPFDVVVYGTPDTTFTTLIVTRTFTDSF